MSRARTPPADPAGAVLRGLGVQMRLHADHRGTGDPALARARELADRRDADQVDITAPASTRARRRRGARRRRRTRWRRAGRCSRSPRPPGRPRNWRPALGELLPADQVAVYPAWETLPHERLSPRSDTVGRRLAVLRRLAHPDAVGAAGPLRVVVAPVRSVLQPQLKGLGDLEPVELHHRRDRRPRRRGAAARRHRVRPHRPGHQAGRVRGPRRDPRRLPADRGAPAAGGVLGRRDRGDPQLRRGRPADACHSGAGVGAAVPRAAAHRRRPGPGPGAGAAAPGTGRDAGQAGRRHPGRGHGVAGAGAARRRAVAGAGAALHAGRRRWCCCATRSGSGPGRTTWSGPARSSCRRAGPRRPAAARPRSTWARPRSGHWPRCAATRPSSGSRGGR